MEFAEHGATTMRSGSQRNENMSLFIPDRH
jgi:hypothetical protein